MFLFRLFQICQHSLPNGLIVVSAVDAYRIGTGKEKVTDQLIVRCRFSRQGYHDVRVMFGMAAENKARIMRQKSVTVKKPLGRGIVDKIIFFAAQAAERGHDGIEIGHCPGFAAAERGEAEGNQLLLKRTQVMAADGEIICQVEGTEAEGRRSICGSHSAKSRSPSVITSSLKRNNLSYKAYTSFGTLLMAFASFVCRKPSLRSVYLLYRRKLVK